jgi:hypothetical protein
MIKGLRRKRKIRKITIEIKQTKRRNNKKNLKNKELLQKETKSYGLGNNHTCIVRKIIAAQN